MKRTDAPYPYEEYQFYKPNFHKKEGRFYISLVHKITKKQTTVSYAKFLYETTFNVKLNKDQFVDHIDDNKSNDVISNLQILSHEDNIKKSLKANSIVKEYIVLKCPNCEIIFTRARNKTHLCKKKNSYTACSRQCSGKTADKIRTGIITDLSDNVVRSEFMGH